MLEWEKDGEKWKRDRNWPIFQKTTKYLVEEWRWTSGQHVCHQLWQSQFESHWSLHFFVKCCLKRTKIARKRANILTNKKWSNWIRINFNNDQFLRRWKCQTPKMNGQNARIVWWAFLNLPAWPDVGIKSCPNLPKFSQKKSKQILL